MSGWNSKSQSGETMRNLIFPLVAPIACAVFFTGGVILLGEEAEQALQAESAVTSAGDVAQTPESSQATLSPQSAPTNHAAVEELFLPAKPETARGASLLQLDRERMRFVTMEYQAKESSR